MQIKHATNDPQSMSQNGDSILKSLQNQNLPNIDLIVRESIQNSLDATLPNAKETILEFKLDKFHTSQLAVHFDEIGNSLKKMYAEESTFLSFSDKNTSGLTGEYNTKDHKKLRESNYQKLIFDIGKNQEQEGAGGSWGLGKTSYFRSGIGLVIYYTRIKVKSGYEERLVGSLIESTRSSKRLLENNPRGIAWWGEYGKDKDIILPLTDGRQIQEILDIFSISRYKENETGTTIIIPYFSSKNQDSLEDIEQYYWENDDITAIKYAVQRWYMPRLMNPKYQEISGNSSLNCLVNGEKLIPSVNTEVTFNVFRELYDAALTGEIPQNLKNKVRVESISFPRLITKKANELAGRVAFREVNKEDLQMTPPNNRLSGLAYLGIKDSSILESFNSKVIAFSRKPGMIIRYAINDDWLPKGAVQDEENLLLAFYVPVSSRKLHPKLQNLGYETMETYLRAIENADHASWDDRDGINIISRTKAEITRAIQNVYKKEEKSKDGNVTASLARRYGQLFVPLKQGRASTIRTNKTKVSSEVTQVKKAILQIDSTNIFKEGNIILRARVSLPKETLSVIEIKLDSQDKIIDLNQWQKMMGNTKTFPIKIIKCEIQQAEDIVKEFNNSYIYLNNLSEETKQVEIALHLIFESEKYSPLLSIKSEKIDSNKERLDG